MKDDYLSQRKEMIDRQIKARGIEDQRVLEAMFCVQRHLFLSKESIPFSYEDSPISIGYGQTISQPFIVAFMTEQVQLSENDTVLEIGTGCGYQTAVLASIVKQVYSLEIIQPLAEAAGQRLKNLGYTNIKLYNRNGFDGCEEHAPFDAIVVTSAPPSIPHKLVEQLKEEGRMIVPVGTYHQELVLVTKRKKQVETKAVLPVRFVPMVSE